MVELQGFNDRQHDTAMDRCQPGGINVIPCCFPREVAAMIHKVILFLAAVLNLIFVAVSIYKKQQNLSIALAIAEIVIVYLWLST